LFKKKQELVKPIQDKIYNAVKKYANDQSYAVIFDKSSDLTMLYANPKYDKSDAILKIMGIKVTTKSGTGGGTPTKPAETTPPERGGAGETAPTPDKK
jgi:outer membrane protein